MGVDDPRCMDEEMAERLNRMESTIAHLEHLTERLNDVVTEQGRELVQLKKKYLAQAQSLETIELERIRSTNAKPPHYSCRARACRVRVLSGELAVERSALSSLAEAQLSEERKSDETDAGECSAAQFRARGRDFRGFHLPPLTVVAISMYQFPAFTIRLLLHNAVIWEWILDQGQGRVYSGDLI